MTPKCKECGAALKVTDTLPTGVLAYCPKCDGALEWRRGK